MCTYHPICVPIGLVSADSSTDESIEESMATSGQASRPAPCVEPAPAPLLLQPPLLLLLLPLLSIPLFLFRPQRGFVFPQQPLKFFRRRVHVLLDFPPDAQPFHRKSILQHSYPHSFEEAFRAAPLHEKFHIQQIVNVASVFPRRLLQPLQHESGVR